MESERGLSPAEPRVGQPNTEAAPPPVVGREAEAWGGARFQRPQSGLTTLTRYVIINEQWRICFFWSEGDAYDVEIVDYHRG